MVAGPVLKAINYTATLQQVNSDTCFTQPSLANHTVQFKSDGTASFKQTQLRAHDGSSCTIQFRIDVRPAVPFAPAPSLCLTIVLSVIPLRAAGS